ncbi:MAG: helix-turn-helix domain-containing protein [Dissulfurispiraceae bacterium]
MKMRETDDLELHWNLKELLLQRNIRRPADFQEMLKAHGLDLTYGAVYALVHEQPARIPARTILTIVKMLGCDVNELIVVRKAGEKPPEAKKPELPKTAKVTKLDEHRRKLTGPRMKFD